MFKKKQIERSCETNNDNADEKMDEKRKNLGEVTDRHGKRRSNVSIKEDPKPQKDRILKNELPKRIVMVKPNSEVRRRLVKQNLVARENNQLLSKKNSFQQVKQRSTLPKRANQKVQRIMKARPKPKSGDKK